jgi:hypothetical protein
MLRAIPMLLTAALSTQAPAPQPASANLAAVQRQTDAYNAHDAQAYANAFLPDAQLIRHPGITALSGRDEIYKNFAKFFRDHKNAQMRILYRAQLGPNTIIEHQEVEGIEKGPVPAAVIYSLKNGLIQAAWFVGAE